MINYISIFDDWTGDSGMFEWSVERLCCPLTNGNEWSRLPALVVPTWEKKIKIKFSIDVNNTSCGYWMSCFRYKSI